MGRTRRDCLAAGLALPVLLTLPGWVRAQAPDSEAKPTKAPDSAQSRRKVSLAVGGKAGFYYLPLTIAEQLGFFAAEGLDLEISDFAGGAKALQAVVGGSADVVSGAFEHTINLQAKGQLFQSIVLQGRAPQIAVGVSLRAIPHYKSIADLKGRKIGVSAPGSSTNMMVNFLLAQAGLKPGDVSFIGVGTSSSAISALRAGHIDALANIEPVMTMLEQKDEVRIIADTRTLQGTRALLGGPMPAACLYAPVAYVQKHPDICQSLANAIVRALKWLQKAGPSDLVKAVPESYLLGDRALYLATFGAVREAFSPDGLLSEDAVRTALKVLQEFDPVIRTSSIDLSKTYTNAFAQRANELYRA